MKKILVLVAVVFSAAAFAQSNPPAASDPAKQPTVGGAPLVQVKPKKPKAAPKATDAAQDAGTDAAQDAGTDAPAAAPKAAKGTKSAKGAPGKPKSLAGKLQACLEIDDATKERLICYDAIFAPQPKPKPPAAKGVNDCRFVKEEDERLTCYNGFADKIPKLPQ